MDCYMYTQYMFNYMPVTQMSTLTNSEDPDEMPHDAAA